MVSDPTHLSLLFRQLTGAGGVTHPGLFEFVVSYSSMYFRCITVDE